MNNRGIVSLVVLLFILISFLFVMNLEYTSKMEYFLTYNNHKSEELYYMARSYNNIVLYNSYHKKLLFDTIGKQLYNRPISLSERNFKVSNINKKIYDVDSIDIGGDYFLENNRLWMNLYSRVKKGNIERESIYSGFFINKIFESDEYLESDIEKDYIRSLYKEFAEDDFLEIDIVREELNDKLDLNLDMINNSNIHLYNSDYNIDKVIKSNKIILKLMEEGSSLNITGKKSEYLEGIIYVNGDLHIEGDLRLYGILIVTGDIFLNESKIYLYGKQFIENDLSGEEIEYIYNESYAYKYGIFMPKFFELDIKVKK